MQHESAVIALTQPFRTYFVEAKHRRKSMKLLQGTSSQSMTSLEIASLVEKRHDNVKRTIETLAERGVISFPQIEEKATAGRPSTFYNQAQKATPEPQHTHLCRQS